MGTFATATATAFITHFVPLEEAEVRPELKTGNAGEPR